MLLQSLFDVSVAATASNCVGLQIVNDLHSRSDVGVGDADTYWLASHAARALQLRSDDIDGATVWYSSSPQVVKTAQPRFEVVVGGIFS